MHFDEYQSSPPVMTSMNSIKKKYLQLFLFYDTHLVSITIDNRIKSIFYNQWYNSTMCFSNVIN